MRVGEVCIMTRDVRRMGDFYRAVLGIAGESADDTHQMIIAEETTLSVYDDGKAHPTGDQRILIAFTVDDIWLEYERLKALGVQIVEPPTARPWGATNMHFLDPDGNVVTFRAFSKEG